MFDSTPPNLPVEPAAPVPLKPAASPAPLMPAASAGPGPKPVPAAPLTTAKGKKEPEDIFSGLDAAAEQQAANEGMTMGEAPKRNPFVIVGIAAAGLLVLAAAGYAVWIFVLHPTTPAALVVTNTTTTPRIPQDQIEQPPVTQQPTPVPQVQATSTEPTPVTQPPPGVNIPLPTVPTPGAPVVTAPGEGVDMDSDKLTDVEEALYGTLVTVADSDGDGFSDGSEVMNLYSPTGKGETITKNKGIMPAAWNGWSMLMPISWKVSTSPSDPSIGTVFTGSSATFTLQTRANTAHQTLAAWIGPDAAGMSAIKTKNGFDGLTTADGLTTYLSAGDTILIVTYQLNQDQNYEYRTTFAMLTNSLRPAAK